MFFGRPNSTVRVSSEPTVELRAVDAYRDGTLALTEIDVSFAAGTVTAVIGPNGAGKSTLFGLISARLDHSAGTMAVRGTVAEVMQATGLDPDLRLTVDDTVRMGRYSNLGLLGRLRAEDHRICDEAIDRLDICHLRSKPITDLSGGERQRVLVAQGLAQDADILLLDEPATGLDVTSQQRILDVIREEADRGKTVIFSTHHLSDADIADTVIALACRCVCCAPPASAFEDPNVISLFERPGLRRAATDSPAA